MIVLRDAAQLPSVTDRGIRALITQRIHELSLDYPWDANELGPFIVVEPGDQLAALDAELGFSLLTSRINGTHFGDPAFMPCHEILEEQARSYEVVVILDDSGYGFTVFVPKDTEVDQDLLTMCARYATPASPD